MNFTGDIASAQNNLITAIDKQLTEDVFKKDDKFSTIFVDYEKGIIEAYNEEGTEVLKTQNFKAIAI